MSLECWDCCVTEKVDQIVDTAEHITVVVEAVADKVDKVVEELEDDLPENSQIKKTLDYIELVAERVENDAHTAGDFIDKVCLNINFFIISISATCH